MKKICEGQMERHDVVHSTIEQYREMFLRAKQQSRLLKDVSSLINLPCTAETNRLAVVEASESERGILTFGRSHLDISQMMVFEDYQDTMAGST